MRTPLLLAAAFLAAMLVVGLVLTGCGTPDVPRRPPRSEDAGGAPPGPPMVPILRLRF